MAFREADDIGREQVKVVCPDLMRPIAQIVAALIRHQNLAARIRQSVDLVSPAVPELWKPVQKKNRPAGPSGDPPPRYAG